MTDVPALRAALVHALDDLLQGGSGESIVDAFDEYLLAVLTNAEW